jgi:hypothetical protein
MRHYTSRTPRPGCHPEQSAKKLHITLNAAQSKDLRFAFPLQEWDTTNPTEASLPAVLLIPAS